MTLRLHVYPDVQQLARAAADTIASDIGWAVTRRGIAHIALSGGATPWLMLEALRNHPIDWAATHVFQVDERDAPDGHDDRSSTHIRSELIDHIALPDSNLHLISNTGDLVADADRYGRDVDALTGGVFDVVHLGLGDDGHTASLVPNDDVLDATGTIAVTGTYRGYRRVTLTFPILNAARSIVWLTNGASKAESLQRLLRGDLAIPAGRVTQTNAVVYCDEAAVTPTSNAE